MDNPEILKRRLERERKARLEAESILEEKSRQLYTANKELQHLNDSLEKEVALRTRELTESQKQFRNLVESAKDVIFNVNQEGKLTYVNPAGLKLLGYSQQELLGKNYSDLIPESHRERVSDFYQNMIDNQEESSYLEFPVLLQNGKIRWVGQLLQVRYRKGMPERVTAVARDIQELRDTRNALENSEKKYRGIIEGMELGLLEVSGQGKVVFVNHWFCEMTGYQPRELIGNNPDEILLDDEGRRLMSEQGQNRQRGQAGVYEIRIRHKSGEFIWVAISGAPVYDRNGKVTGTVGMHLDITPQKKMQAQLERAIREAEDARRAEKEFLAHMSHEIRTPLNALVGMANLLASTGLTEDQVEYVNDMRQASDVLHGLISDVLDISKIEAGEVEVNRSLIELEPTLSSLIRTLEYRARERGNQIRLFMAEGLPARILADRNILHQIMLNLLGNAIKFTENGKIDIRVSAYDLREEDIVLQVEVADTGAGIKPEQLDEIFKRFRQEKNSTPYDHQGGTGLGLSICKMLVELHGGKISVKSEPGKGTLFTFTILVQKVGPGQLSSSGRSHPEKHRSFDELNILVAEDSYLNRKYIQGLLAQWGADYTVTEDGTEALAKSQENSYDLILMDMQMPRMDGYEAAKRIRKDQANPNRQTPILALTASALVDERKKALEAGMDDHLTKPFTPYQLRDFIARNLRVDRIEATGTATEFSFNSIELPPYLDAVQLDKMYDGDLEHARRMFGLYTNVITREIANARRLMDTKDRKGLASWLHKQGPAMAMIGLDEKQAEFRELENRLKSGKGISKLKLELSELFAELEHYQTGISRVTAELENRAL
mgnify:CR=1 FL=1